MKWCMKRKRPCEYLWASRLNTERPLPCTLSFMSYCPDLVVRTYKGCGRQVYTCFNLCYSGA